MYHNHRTQLTIVKADNGFIVTLPSKPTKQNHWAKPQFLVCTTIEDVISKVNEFNETTYTEGDDYFGDYGMDMATVSPIVKEG